MKKPELKKAGPVAVIAALVIAGIAVALRRKAAATAAPKPIKKQSPLQQQLGVVIMVLKVMALVMKSKEASSSSK